MTAAVFYMLESSLLVALLYGLYYLALRGETFFRFNRYYLLAIPVMSLLLPLIHNAVDVGRPPVADQPIGEISKIRNVYYDALSAWEYGAFERVDTKDEIDAENNNNGAGKTLLLTACVFYLLGLFVCSSRTVWTLRWIRKTILKHPTRTQAGLTIVLLPYPTVPFSFFRFVFVHEPVSQTADFETILAHEQIHAEEKHSVDLLIVQLAAALLWFNPLMWYVVKSLKATHEYIADQKIINSGYSATAYQTLLLRQLISNNSTGLVHNFNLSFIKRRITMMKHKRSGWPGKLKLAAALLFAAFGSLAIIQCNTRLEEDSLATTAQRNPVDIPVLPASGFRFKGDLTNAPRFTISDNKLRVNGAPVKVDELAALLEGTEAGREVPIVIEADIDQRMGFIRDLDMALRKIDRRKLLYLGSTDKGDQVEVMIILPPDPAKVVLPDADRLAEDGQLDLMKIFIGNGDPVESENSVYDFVKNHISKGSDAYVVSVKMNDTDRYNDYLLHVFHVKEAFHRIYQERSQELFGKDFFDTTPDEYKKAREGIPMSISIAER